MEMIPLCSAVFELGAHHPIGKTAFGVRMIAEIASARWSGDRFSATMVGSAAADWALAGDDGLVRIDVRMTLKTDDEELVYVAYDGLVDGAAEGAPARCAMRFETAANRYRWLTRTIAVGRGRFDEAGSRVIYDCFALA
jgi:hypothetical protein